MKKILSAGRANRAIVFFLPIFIMLTSWASASTSTIREVERKGNTAEILLDSNLERGSVQVDFVRDIVQFSISQATIYPAKMIHAQEAMFSKIFAYQYSPNLVRIRFTVDQSAELYKDKIKWSVEGKKLVIHFNGAPPVAKEDDEKSILEKITKTEERPSEVKAEVKPEARTLTGNTAAKKPIKLGGAKNGPSPLRSMLSILLIVGGLGMILLYIKRRNGGAIQAKKVGGSWFSSLIPQNRRPKAMMEVISTHVLGPKQSIVVMKIRGQQFVLAVTAENIQLITQLDSEEAETDLLDDPKVAASIGKMFGVEKPAKPIETVNPPADLNFGNLLKKSNGAGAIIARNAYAEQSGVRESTVNPVQTAMTGVIPTAIKPNPASSSTPSGGARDLIRRRLEGIR